MNLWRVIQGDVRTMLATLPDQSVQTCATSPPYWGLRDYGAEGQLGLEDTPDAYVTAMVGVFREVRRVLRDDGTLWLNLGDSYATQGGAHGGREDNQRGVGAKRMHDAGGGDQAARRAPDGLKPKDLVGIPWMVAFALRADGWYLRCDIIWHKPNPMPESVTDRPTKAHEYLFLLSKSARYYYNWESIQEAGAIPAGTRAAKGGNVRSNLKDVNGRPPEYWDYTGKRNKRSVWTVNTQPYSGAHFATYPEDLITPCILAGSKEGDLVLDPFTGSGTTGAVAIRHRRNFIGVELNHAYVELARQRIGVVAPMFAEETP